MFLLSQLYEITIAKKPCPAQNMGCRHCKAWEATALIAFIPALTGLMSIVVDV
jgi:hypothetical protein